MGLTEKQIYDLNNAMEANRKAALGTELDSYMDKVDALEVGAVVAGKYVADADDATADLITIATGLTAITGFIVQIYRAGVYISSTAAVITVDEGDLIITQAATYVITTGDVVNYIVW